MTYAGTLRDKLIFQEPTQTSDGMGGVTTTWGDSFTTFGERRPLTANEQINWGKIEHEITHRIFLRFDKRIVPTMRIKYFDYRMSTPENKYFKIVSLIDKAGRGINYEILATEIKDE